MDALHDKYHDQGLRIIGMNVWEDSRDKVSEFVKKAGDRMSYSVAYCGVDGEFAHTWLKAADIRGIPFTFILRDGKYLFSTHPSNLDDESIKTLLRGGEAAEKVVQKHLDAEATKTAVKEQIRAFQQAKEHGDVEAMAKTYKKAIELNAEHPEIYRLRTVLAVVTQNWTEALNAIKDAETPAAACNVVGIIVEMTDDSTEELPVELLSLMAETLESFPNQVSPLKAMLARVQWKLGKKDEAIQSAKEAVSLYGRLSKKALEAFAASFQEGTPQTYPYLLEKSTEQLDKEDQ